MNSPVLPKRIPQRAEVGARGSFSRTITEADVALFIGVTWDVNPLHTDETYARATRFGRRIVPGLLTASLATHLGGLWAFMASEMHFEFLGPVYVGDTITTTAEVIESNQEKGFVRLRIECVNAEGTAVLRGEVAGFPGRHEE
jgi:3-hydroxybutyryl-CoA dehydratase